jgi:hypothetical protein
MTFTLWPYPKGSKKLSKSESKSIREHVEGKPIKVKVTPEEE